MVLENKRLSVSVCDSTGSWQLHDHRSGAIWESASDRFGTVTIQVEGESQALPLVPDAVHRTGNSLRLSCHSEDFGRLALDIWLRIDDDFLEVSYTSTGKLPISSIRLLDDVLQMTDQDEGYLLVPVRLGLLIPSDSGLEFTHRFGTYDYEGCHMAMLGAVKNGNALAVTWHDPYVVAEVNSRLGDAGQQVSASLELSKTARSVRLHPLGVGDINTIAQAYRDIARQKGWLVTWADKLKEQPQAERLFGAANFKLWTALARRIDEELNEVSVDVHWTFDEVAQIAEHLKTDLDLDKVLYILGGWIHRGYDCEHPDILPAAPECGGDDGLKDCVQRVQDCGYPIAFHDNYQDMYRDAPSWNEDFIMKRPDGSLSTGGLWLGGRAYLTCSKKAVELAMRPQNLPEVKRRFNPDVYFIDTTYAAGLCECYDSNHPLTKWDDMHWKQAISDEAREIFGLFGSECGREWAIPHADWFEGLTGVGGRYYHNLDPDTFGGTVVPLFEMVYRDGVVMHGKYGYKPFEAGEYVLHHVSIGRTLHYHSIGNHLYWEQDSTEEIPLPEGGADRACFTRAHRGWAEGMCLTDRFIKNTYEILSPLNELTSQTRLTEIRFLNPNRKVRETRFGSEARVVANGTHRNFAAVSDLGKKVWLPPFGFLVESPTFIAIHALSWGSIEYEKPVLFTMRALDGLALSKSKKIRIYHGFGDVRLSWRGKLLEIPREVEI